MSTPRERQRARQARLTSTAPANHQPVPGMAVSYVHPAGNVSGTIVAVGAKAVTVRIHRVDGLPELVQLFTKRSSGEYALVGKAFPVLRFLQAPGAGQ